MSKVLKNYIREIVLESFQSHTFEPVLGDPIVNVNPNCKHYQSRGTVMDIKPLAGDAGTIVVYQVSNGGENFSPGDILEKTLDQLAPDDGIYEVRRFISGVLKESVEFRELDSPLRYSRATNVKRLALCDTSVEEPNLSPSGRPMSDAYFNEKQEWEYYGRGKSRNRRLKKPRKGQLVPGVSDVCVIGFLDYHDYGKTTDGKQMWYIDYMKTRGDKGGQKVASRLIDEFFKRYAEPGSLIHFGKMMRQEIGHLKDKMEKQYPDVNVIGAENW